MNTVVDSKLSHTVNHHLSVTSNKCIYYYYFKELLPAPGIAGLDLMIWQQVVHDVNLPLELLQRWAWSLRRPPPPPPLMEKSSAPLHDSWATHTHTHLLLKLYFYRLKQFMNYLALLYKQLILTLKLCLCVIWSTFVAGFTAGRIAHIFCINFFLTCF